MAPRHSHVRFVEKACDALVAAIEIYNKPNFEYREETFCLLAINAWEILLKARVLQLAGNDLRSLYVYGTRDTKKGRKSKKRYIIRTSAKTARTISLHGCINSLDKNSEHRLPDEVKGNLNALSEIRDAAAHFVSASSVLRSQVLGIAVASVKNFVTITKNWFDIDLADRLSIILPLAFLYPEAGLPAVNVTMGEGRLIDYLRELAQAQASGKGPYDVAVNVEVRLKRSNLSSATKVQIVNDPTATPVTLTEQDIRASYPWTYDELTAQLAKRYSNFSQNARYHALRRTLSADKRYAWVRHLDPTDPKSQKKQFYHQSILNEFDKHYSLATK